MADGWDDEIDELFAWAAVDVLRRHGGGMTTDELGDVIERGCVGLLADPSLADDGRDLAYAIPLMAVRDETVARWAMETRRWRGAMACPRCGSPEAHAMMDRRTGRRRDDGKCYCPGCQTVFTVRTGTTMEESRVALRHWCYAIWAAFASASGGVTAAQIRTATGVSNGTALSIVGRLPALLDGTASVTRPNAAAVAHAPGRTRIGAELRLVS